MKPLKIFLLAVIYTIVFYSCNDEIETPKPPPPPPQRSEQIDGRFLLVKSATVGLNEHFRLELKVHFEGIGEMNVFGPATLTMDHHEVMDIIKNKSDLNEGDFILRNENGIKLIGQYSGVNKNLSENSIYTAVINGGSGEFENAYGSITLELIPQGNSEYLTEIKGTVFYKDNNNPPVL